MAGASRQWGWGAVAAALWWASGCVSPPADAQARLDALEAEEARMDAAFDTVETRLLGSQARLHLWQELERRHAQVSAIQCRVSNAHLEAMARHLEHQERKAVEQRRQRSLAAVNNAVFTSAPAGALGH